MEDAPYRLALAHREESDRYDEATAVPAPGVTTGRR
jgi:hypothetical protein